MERLTQQTKWTDDIELKKEYGYKYIYQRLAEYENTGISPSMVWLLIQALRDKNMRQKITPTKPIYSIKDQAHCPHCYDAVADNGYQCSCGQCLDWDEVKGDGDER